MLGEQQRHEALGVGLIALGLLTGLAILSPLLTGDERNLIGPAGALLYRSGRAAFGAAAALSGILHLVDPQNYASPVFMLLSGGLMLGAVFMATDMVASPITNAGCWLYGFLIAVLVVVIRFWGGMPEGVMYAILLANAVSPHIDNLIQPRVFGTGRKVK